MATSDNLQEAVDVLQQLGLKEYEARCFVGLSQQSTGTAKQLSEITDVPRTRVYDAVRVLEAQGLVEIQHSSPRKFRAVSLSEATETLRDQYEKRVDRLHDALDNIELHTADDESLLTETLVDQLTGINGDIDLLVGAPTNSIRTRIQEAIPGATTFVSGLEWLQEEPDDTGETAIGRLVLVDRSTILVSSIVPSTGKEHAIFGEGFGNGLVVIARRLMSQGQFTAND